MAIGITSFALMTLVGLLPIGLSVHHSAMDANVSSHIVQQVVTDFQQADFDSLLDADSNVKKFPIRYFDDQGAAVATITNAAQERIAIYEVATGVKNFGNSLALLTIDILNNPGKKPFQRDPNTGGIKSEAENGISPSRFSVSIARNQ